MFYLWSNFAFTNVQLYKRSKPDSKGGWNENSNSIKISVQQLSITYQTFATFHYFNSVATNSWQKCSMFYVLMCLIQYNLKDASLSIKIQLSSNSSF